MAEESRKQNSDEEDYSIVAQRLLNIFRQLHVFTPERKKAFDDMIIEQPPEVRNMFGKLVGGGALQEYVEELEEKAGIRTVRVQAVPTGIAVDAEDDGKEKVQIIQVDNQAQLAMQNQLLEAIKNMPKQTSSFDSAKLEETIATLIRSQSDAIVSAAKIQTEQLAKLIESILKESYKYSTQSIVETLKTMNHDSLETLKEGFKIYSEATPAVVKHHPDLIENIQVEHVAEEEPVFEEPMADDEELLPAKAEEESIEEIFAEPMVEEEAEAPKKKKKKKKKKDKSREQLVEAESPEVESETVEAAEETSPKAETMQEKKNEKSIDDIILAVPEIDDISDDFIDFGDDDISLDDLSDIKLDFDEEKAPEKVEEVQKEKEDEWEWVAAEEAKHEPKPEPKTESQETKDKNKSRAKFKTKPIFDETIFDKDDEIKLVEEDDDNDSAWGFAPKETEETLEETPISDEVQDDEEWEYVEVPEEEVEYETEQASDDEEWEWEYVEESEDEDKEPEVTVSASDDEEWEWEYVEVPDDDIEAEEAASEEEEIRFEEVKTEEADELQDVAEPHYTRVDLRSVPTSSKALLEQLKIRRVRAENPFEDSMDVFEKEEYAPLGGGETALYSEAHTPQEQEYIIQADDMDDDVESAFDTDEASSQNDSQEEIYDVSFEEAYIPEVFDRAELEEVNSLEFKFIDERSVKQPNDSVIEDLEWLEVLPNSDRFQGNQASV